MKFGLATLILALSSSAAAVAAPQTTATPRYPSFPGSTSISYQDIQRLVNGVHEARAKAWEAITYLDTAAEILAKVGPAAQNAYNIHQAARVAMRSAFEKVKQADNLDQS
ncbi:hypothetical protein GGF47_003584 [Coemansia sp. RSA 2524]|nr:hypothetical protein GGH98_002322 [Coemansia sp. RSA 454]KAJ2422492.1 hypothetical protein GGF47_003584 [Coemansia sp. RSA 2524]